MTVADHVQKVMKPNFAASWDEVGEENELEDTYALSTMKTLEGTHNQNQTKKQNKIKIVINETVLIEFISIAYVCTIAEAVKNIIQFMGMQPCERSDKVPEDKSAHTLYLAGVFRGGHDVLVRAKLALSEGVTMQITVRSTDAHVSEIIASCVG